MSRIRNSLAVAAGAGALAARYVETPWAVLYGFGAGVGAYAVKPLLELGKWSLGKLGELKDSTVKKARESNPTESVKSALWALSPTNPDSNVLLGTGLGMIADVALKDRIKDFIPNPVGQVAAEVSMVLAGTATGLYFDQTRVSRGRNRLADKIDPPKKQDEESPKDTLRGRIGKMIRV